MKKTGVGVAVMVWKEDLLLLIKRGKEPGKGEWSPPGGRLEFRESFEDCAAREVHEETNVLVSDMRFIGVTNDLHPDPNRHGVTIWFEGKYQSGELKNNSPEEVDEIQWVRKDSIPTERFLPFRQILEGHALKKS